MMPPDRVHAALTATSRDVQLMGPTAWRRFTDWETHPHHGRDILRGGGIGDGKSDDRLDDERLDRQAAGYRDELDRLTRRIDADLHRLRTLLRVANPDRPSTLRPGELTNAQLIADGWCPSCFRDDQHLAPLAEGRYRDRCRACGDLRGREGREPTMDELRLMHSRGKRIRQRSA